MTKNANQPQGKLQTAIMKEITSHKILKVSKVFLMINAIRATSSYSINKLAEKGLLEKHGRYICLPGLSDSVPIEKPRKKQIKRTVPYTPRSSRPLPSFVDASYFLRNPPFVL